MVRMVATQWLQCSCVLVMTYFLLKDYNLLPNLFERTSDRAQAVLRLSPYFRRHHILQQF